MIKYFCDATGKELELNICLFENDKLESEGVSIYTDGVIQRVGFGGVFNLDNNIYCKEEALKRFPQLNKDDFNSDIWG